ncbi:MAG: histidine--tRNA ligase [Candidatus Tritonobacter lacicola]|nr:histidine--tRNA ligase [Candidatus Tritonobacter lacicola]
MKIKAPKGTADTFPPVSEEWERVGSIMAQRARCYGYGLIKTPVFERTELFTRSIGAATDIVKKEMYTFEDRAGRSMTLKPEETAPVVRAYIEHGLDKRPGLTKLYYMEPIFRYERPQSGRYRQHHQFGVEAIGSADPSLDAEVMRLLMDIYAVLGLEELVLRVNSVGCSSCRGAFREKLRDALSPALNLFCEDCRRRYGENPLRLFDCKNEKCRELLSDGPFIDDNLCEGCGSHFRRVLSLLELLDVPFVKDGKLVRGLDYYTRTTFEVVSGELGAQNAVGGGGRYDGLVELLGGRPTPCVGFGTGMERVLAVMKEQDLRCGMQGPPAVFLALLGDRPRERGLKLMYELRQAFIHADTDYFDGSLKAQLRQANKRGFRLVIIIGEEELAGKSAKIKDMLTGEEEKILLVEAVERIKAICS